MQKVVALAKRFRHVPSEVIALDFGASATKAVRARRHRNSITITAVDLLPPAPFAVTDKSTPDAADVAFELPKALRCRYAALLLPGEGAVVKLLSLPGHGPENPEQIQELMGLSDSAAYRMAYEKLPEDHGRSETRFLAVGLPENQAQSALGLFPQGAPAARSIEISGLASLNAFLCGLGKNLTEQCVAVADFGYRITTLSMVNKGAIVLIRKFDLGTEQLHRGIQKKFGVDPETAEGIVLERSFDISGLVKETLRPFVQQLVISRDFVERRENCRVERLYASGGAAHMREWMNDIASSSGLEAQAWNPFENLSVAPGAMSERVQGQEGRFAAAVGGALAFLEAS